jgi:hypothetical protein
MMHNQHSNLAWCAQRNLITQCDKLAYKVSTCQEPVGSERRNLRVCVYEEKPKGLVLSLFRGEERRSETAG